VGSVLPLGTETPARGPLPRYRRRRPGVCYRTHRGERKRQARGAPGHAMRNAPSFVRPKDAARSGGTQKVLGRSTSRQEGCSGLVRRCRSRQDLRRVADARGCLDPRPGYVEEIGPACGLCSTSGTKTPVRASVANTPRIGDADSRRPDVIAPPALLPGRRRDGSGPGRLLP
jgi:hypothetical protein